MVTILKGVFLKNQGCQNLLLLGAPFKQNKCFFNLPPGQKITAPLIVGFYTIPITLRISSVLLSLQTYNIEIFWCFKNQ